MATITTKKGGSAEQVEVAIIGAGIAGLAAAKTLTDHGIDNFALFEGKKFVGGRMESTTDPFGTPVNLGGTFINDYDQVMIRLAKEAGVKLVEYYNPGHTSLRYGYYVAGEYHSETDYIKAVDPLIQQFKADVPRLNDPEFIGHWQGKSARDYLEQVTLVPWIREAIEHGIVNFEGVSSADIKALYFLEISGFDKISASNPNRLGDGFDQYVIEEGSQALCQKIGNLIRAPIYLDHALESIRSDAQGFRLSFSNKEVHAAKVVFATPFTAMRNVQIESGLFSDGKMEAINGGLEYAAYNKVITGFSKNPLEARPEVTIGQCQYGDLWLDSKGMPNAKSHNMILMRGGADALDTNMASARKLHPEILRMMNVFFPGSANYHNGYVAVSNWNDPNDRLSPQGGFSVRPDIPEQILAIRQSEAGGLIHFIGEHTAKEAKLHGYMEGAANRESLLAEFYQERNK